MADTSPDVKDSKMTSEENPSVVTELKELVSLLEKGHITPDEFKGFKKALLARADAKETTEQDPHGEALLERIVQLEKDANTIKEMNKVLMTRIEELKQNTFSQEDTCQAVEWVLEDIHPPDPDYESFFCRKEKCLAWYHNPTGKWKPPPVLDKDGNYPVHYIIIYNRKLVTKDPNDDNDSVTSCY